MDSMPMSDPTNSSWLRLRWRHRVRCILRMVKFINCPRSQSRGLLMSHKRRDTCLTLAHYLIFFIKGKLFRLFFSFL